MSAVCIIPAKATSTRLPGKNKRPFHGKPIIQYSIELARASALFDQVCVATDDPEIRQLVEFMGCSVWKRPAWSVQDSVGTQQVTMNCIEEFGAAREWDYEYACCIYATAPLIVADDLAAGYRLVAEGLDFALAVGAEPLRDAGAFYWSRVAALLDGAPLLGARTGLVVLPEERVCDINTESDWTRAGTLYAEMRPVLGHKKT